MPADLEIVLRQSHRVPHTVHRFAEDLIHQVKGRQEKEYLPRPEDGVLDRFARDSYNDLTGDFCASLSVRLVQKSLVRSLALGDRRGTGLSPGS